MIDTRKILLDIRFEHIRITPGVFLAAADAGMGSFSVPVGVSIKNQSRFEVTAAAAIKEASSNKLTSNLKNCAITSAFVTN